MKNEGKMRWSKRSAGQQQADNVDQDVTGWQTLKIKTKPMTQAGKHGAEGSKSRKTIQICVRVDGSMESLRDVSLSDKVGDVMKRIPNSAWQQA